MENAAQKAYSQVDKVGVLAMLHWVVLYVHCFLDIFKGRLSRLRFFPIKFCLSKLQMIFIVT